MPGSCQELQQHNCAADTAASIAEWNVDEFGLLPSCLRIRIALPSVRALHDESAIGLAFSGEGDHRTSPKSKELASYLASSRLAFNFLTYQRDVRDADAVLGAAEASEAALQSLLV